MPHTVDIHVGDALSTLRNLPDRSVQCCVTSPPYWGLRDYGQPGQLGLEPVLADYITGLVTIFREVHRVLKDDGTLWVNLGDSYSGGGRGGGGVYGKDRRQRDSDLNSPVSDLPSKNLVGVPWRVAFALQDDGWILRQDIIWSKPNPMPESVRDRCTKSHEYLFLLSKRPKYYYDADAIALPATPATIARISQPQWGKQQGSSRVPGKANGPMKAVIRRSGNITRKAAAERGIPAGPQGQTRSNLAGSIPWEGITSNRRSVWRIPTKPFRGAHFAVMPTELAELCVKAGSRLDDTILDPFAGAGTTGLAAERLQRNAILCELNPDYALMAQRRIWSDNALFCRVNLHQGQPPAQS